MRTRLKRMWVNQPSTLQEDHRYHGLRVLAEDYKDSFVRIWFTSGAVESSLIRKTSLSDGWPQKKE